MSERRVSRRDFILTAAAGSLLGEACAAGQAKGVQRMLSDPVASEPSLKLGVASYSLRNFSRVQAIEMTRSLGVKYINFKSMHLPYDASAPEFALARQQLAAAGLELVGGGMITFETDTDDGVRKYFDYAKAAGMPTVVCTCKPATLPRIEKFAKQYNVKVAIHNHGPEDKIFPSPYDVYKAVKGRDKHMGLCVDIGHTWRAGVDPTKAVLELRDRVYDLHVKDLANLKDRDSQVIVGKGAIDFPSLFRALIKIGYTGHVGLEYEIDADNPLPGMQQSFAYMRGVLAGISQT